MTKGKLIIFSAPSGAGKTSIVKEVLKNKKFKLEFSVSACSRNMREGETNGKDYLFLSIDDFKNKISANEFIEWEEVYEGNFYGTLKSEVERIRGKGNNVIFDVDVIGGLNIKKYFEKEALSIFIMPPSVKELEDRLLKRATDTIEDIKRRVAKAEDEIKYSDKFDKIIINDNLQKAIDETHESIFEFIK